MDKAQLLGCFGAMYYVGKNGQQTGPFTLEQVQAKYASGEISPTDLMWKEGTADWKAASEFSELAAPAPGSPPLSTTSPPQAAPTLSSGSPYVPQSPAPGAYPPGGGLAPGAQVPNYLVWAILSTICCCIPFGIPAIVFASQVNTKLAAGDVAGAIQASEKAKMWCWIAFGCGLASSVVYGIVQFVIAQQGGY